MARFLKKIDPAVGAPPGTLIFVGSRKVEDPHLTVIEYSSDRAEEECLTDLSRLSDFAGTSENVWINLDGVHDVSMIKQIGDYFGISALVLEDIVNTTQRPKMEELDDVLFISLKMLYLDNEELAIHAEQLSMIVGRNYILTFQEKPGDVFDHVRQRIRKGRGRIRKMGADYLAYALLDSVFENYIKIIEFVGEQVEGLEDDVLDNPDNELLERISLYRREFSYIRKAVRPAREVVGALTRLEDGVLDEDVRPFLRDLIDLSEQAVEAVEAYREMLSDYMGMYSSAVSNKLNEIMKFLTIFSTIFIPMTFMAGVYGMNFEYLPELKFKYAYLVFWMAVAGVVLVMLKFFRKKKWI